MNSPFSIKKQQVSSNIFGAISSSDIIFVSDLFTEDYVGGAELTSDALIKGLKRKVFKLHSKNVTIDTLKAGFEKFWIFGNFSQMNLDLIPTIVANLSYSIVEYDYKFCKARSQQKHQSLTGTPCDCNNDMFGKLISSFFFGAKALFWMSEKQRDVYFSKFPFLKQNKNIVISSAFDAQSLSIFKSLATKNKNDTWIVLGSQSWVKGFKDAEEYCKLNKLKYEVVWDLSYQDLLKKLATSRGFVYLPAGDDTCPRMVIEAKLLDCELVLNDFVQHKDEAWFDTKASIYKKLESNCSQFGDEIESIMSYIPTISGYTTTLNCIKQGYPFKQTILSLLGFCDEVIVVDGGSTDGTLDVLKDLASKNDKVKIHVQERDWSHKRFAVFDGQQKALARSLCTKEFCWQMDSDEVVHESDYAKVKMLVKNFIRDADLIALPVIEYWGSLDKVRCDVNSWKWRLSRNKQQITHGIPSRLRRYDEDGDLYSAEGSDGCDYVRLSDYEVVQCVIFSGVDEAVRQKASLGDMSSLMQHQSNLNRTLDVVPCVFHFSWFNINRKIKTYKDYWTKHWNSLYNKAIVDSAETNMFFDKPWSEVSEEEIDARAKQLASETSGWVWHRKWDGTKTYSVNVNKKCPAVILDWVKENS